MIEQIHCNFKGTNAFIREREVLNLGLLIIWKHHLIGIKQYTYATYHVVRKVHKGITETDCEGSSVILKIHEKKENLGHSPFFRIPYSAPSMGFSFPDIGEYPYPLKKLGGRVKHVYKQETQDFLHQ